MERFFTARGLRLERGLPSAHAKLHAKISLTGVGVDRTAYGSYSWAGGWGVGKT